MDMGKLNNSFLMCFTETHLKKNIIDNEFINQDWNIIGADSIRRMHGGVALY